MDPRWYAIRTKPRQEVLVSSHLHKHHHLRVFLPRLAVPKRRRERRVTVVEALFPSYLFVHMPLEPDPWYAIRWTPGVKAIVGIGDQPVEVPEEAIQLLMSRCEAGDIIPWRPRLAAGTSVRILYGPFAGLVGLLERLPRKAERVRVLLDLLGSKVPAEVDLVDLEAIS